MGVSPDVPHPGLLPEDVLTDASRVLEMRVYWGTILLDIDHRRTPKAITIGETKNTDVFISSEGLPRDEFPIIRTIDGDYVLAFTNAMDGELEAGGGVQSLTSLRGTSLAQEDSDLDGAYRVKLYTDARAIVHWGGITLAFRFVPPAQALPNTFWKGADLQAANVLLTSIFIHLALIVTLMTYPSDTASLREDIFDDPRHAILFEPPKMDEKIKTTLRELKKARDNEAEVVAEKRSKPEKVAPKQPTTVDSPMEKLHKLLASGVAGGGAGDILNGGSISGTLANVIGSMRSSAPDGLAGLGIRGGIPLGGGIPTSRGIANIGTVGRLGDPAYGVSKGLGARKERSIASLSTPTVVGALPREVIQRVINDNKAQIRYCYEIELQRDQTLDGKVAMKWIIGATGAVTLVVVAESTMKSTQVGQCLAEKIKSWRFPQPAGGGVVEVNYPFVFQSR